MRRPNETGVHAKNANPEAQIPRTAVFVMSPDWSVSPSVPVLNLLAERETTMILRLLHDISSHLGLKGVSSKELEDLLKETRVDELYRKLEKALPTEQ